jgi:phospholipid/cholesterol/gamma-HCH transport system permease protein
MPVLNLERLGRRTLHTAVYSAGTWRLLRSSMGRVADLRIPSVRMVLYRQIYFTGVEALGTVALIAALLGIVIITEVASLIGSNAELTGKILVWTVVRELGPLLTATLIVARSCTAVASELGSMKLNGEVSHLITMGIDPYGYLLVPRILGMTIAVVLLTVYFQLCSIAGGLVFSSQLFLHIEFLRHLQGIFAELRVFDIAISLLKSLVFGILLSAGSCYHGFRVKASLTEIPQVTAVAVIQSLFLMFVIDGLITVTFFL